MPDYQRYTDDGFDLIRSDPVYLVRGGYVSDGLRSQGGFQGRYWSKTDGIAGYSMHFSNANIFPQTSVYLYAGASIRCIALSENNFQPVNPDNPSGGGGTENNANNTYNNVYNSSSSSDTNTDAADNYVAPQGVVNSATNNSPNWFLIICLGVLSLGLIVLIIFLILRLRKQNRA